MNSDKLVEATLKKPEDLLKPEKPSSDNRLRILDLEVNLASGSVWRRETVLDLPELSYRLLAVLATRAPELVGKDELIAEVWGDVVVSDETLAQRVRLLRQALGDDSQNPRYIAAVRGRGYRLAAPVEVVRGAADPGSRVRRRWFVAALTAAVLLGIFIYLAMPGSDDAVSPHVETVAVLPFADHSANQTFGYFADGMQEELLARLANLGEIAVLSRTSVERYRDTTHSIRDIARSLDADAVIEGSVRLNDEQLRITVQLIDGDSDQHLWAETYEAELTVENIFSIQERVATAIAEALRVEYRRQQASSLGLPTADIEAYNLYLLGRYHTFRQTPQDLELATTYLREAVRLDPEFAEAFAALGWAYSFLGTIYGQRKPETVYPKARDAALRALELDDRLGDAHSIYADIATWYDWDFDLAESEYRRTVALDPLNVLGYALFLSTQERHDEAIEWVERRVAAAPRDDYVLVNAAWRYYHAGRFGEAIEKATLAKSHPDALPVLGMSHLAQGDIDEALAAFEEDLARKGRGSTQIGRLALAYLHAGNEREAEPLISELDTRADQGEYVSPVALAAIYLAMGDDDRGFEMLDTAVEARERSVIFLNVSTSFSQWRDDPRFIAILERIGLPVPGR